MRARADLETCRLGRLTHLVAVCVTDVQAAAGLALPQVAKGVRVEAESVAGVPGGRHQLIRRVAGLQRLPGSIGLEHHHRASE